MQLRHSSAPAHHYDKAAKDYDTFNEATSALINRTIEAMLRRYDVQRVLDVSCGTGSQVFWLAKRGFSCVGVDINTKMLRVARRKARESKRSVRFLEGDMRTLKLGGFDAVLSIFNAVGHLTKSDFKKAMRRAYANLNPGGVFIFDIFNLAYLLKEDHITRLTIDWHRQEGASSIRDVQHSTINKAGVLASYTTSYRQRGKGPPRVSHHAQTLQTYTAQQLRDMLEGVGFRVRRQCAIDGSRLRPTQSERILTVASK